MVIIANICLQSWSLTSDVSLNIKCLTYWELRSPPPVIGETPNPGILEVVKDLAVGLVLEEGQSGHCLEVPQNVGWWYEGEGGQHPHMHGVGCVLEVLCGRITIPPDVFPVRLGQVEKTPVEEFNILD